MKLHEPHRLGSRDEARIRHEWLVYNEHILKGYRVNYHSYKLLIKSAFTSHNETTNFWSHWSAALLFIFLFIYFGVYFMPLDLDLNTIVKSQSYSRSNGYNVSSRLETSIQKAWQTSININSSSANLRTSTQHTEDSVLVKDSINKLRDLEIELKQTISEIGVETPANTLSSYS